jgi:hypothetical protein
VRRPVRDCTGGEAQAFAKIMRHHTMEATGGKTYSQMGQYLDANGKGTDDKTKAAVDPTTKQPVAAEAREERPEKAPTAAVAPIA